MIATKYVKGPIWTLKIYCSYEESTAWLSIAISILLGDHEHFKQPLRGASPYYPMIHEPLQKNAFSYVAHKALGSWTVWQKTVPGISLFDLLSLEPIFLPLTGVKNHRHTIVRRFNTFFSCHVPHRYRGKNQYFQCSCVCCTKPPAAASGRCSYSTSIVLPRYRLHTSKYIYIYRATTDIATLEQLASNNSQHSSHNNS